MALRTVVLPTSVGPIEWVAGIVLGTLAFPCDARKSAIYADAYWRESIRLTAIDDRDFSNVPYPIPPRLLVMRDSTADKILAEGDKMLFARKCAWFATQSLFSGALRGSPYSHIRDDCGSMPSTAENRYLATNRWLGKSKKENTSTKPLIRDAIAPSRAAIHLAYALWKFAHRSIEISAVKNENDALRAILGKAELLAELIHFANKCRALALIIPELRVTDGDLIEFVAV